MTLVQHAKRLLDEGHGHDGAIMQFIHALYLAEDMAAYEEAGAAGAFPDRVKSGE